MNPVEDRRELDADDREIDDIAEAPEPISTSVPLEADEADVLDQRAEVPLDDDGRSD